MPYDGNPVLLGRRHKRWSSARTKPIDRCLNRWDLLKFTLYTSFDSVCASVLLLDDLMSHVSTNSVTSNVCEEGQVIRMVNPTNECKAKGWLALRGGPRPLAQWTPQDSQLRPSVGCRAR